MEGEQEISLLSSRRWRSSFNDVPLWIRPQSFFQTNPTGGECAVRYRARLGEGATG